jgi:hypothetical protein
MIALPLNCHSRARVRAKRGPSVNSSGDGVMIALPLNCHSRASGNPAPAIAERFALWRRAATLQPAHFWVPACAGMTTFFCAAVLCALVLAGCASSTPLAGPQRPHILCTAIPPHTKLEQSVLAGELPNDGPESQRWIGEYARLRLSCRAAENAR